MLEKEFQYYKDHQQELAKKYNGKFVVIVGERVVGAYHSEFEAYNETKKSHPMGTFLIQLCSNNPDTLIQLFYSGVTFK